MARFGVRSGSVAFVRSDLDLENLLREHKAAAFGRGRAKPGDPVFASEAGTPMERRNVAERGLGEPIKRSGLDDPAQPKLTMNSLRDTFASHLILDLALDVVQVSRQLGDSKPSIPANTYARLFDQARHAEAIRTAMAASEVRPSIPLAPARVVEQPPSHYLQRIGGEF
jgi:integrase